MTHIGIITGSTRPGRRCEQVATWVADVAQQYAARTEADVTFELVDIADFDLPLLDEPAPAIMGRYEHQHTKAWSAKVAGLDGFVFVTPEYNHSVPAALKNAIDYLFEEWNDKAAGFVSYGLQSGARSVEHLRPVMAELKVADVRTHVALSLFTDFELTDPVEVGVFEPGDHQESTLVRLLDEVVEWSTALQSLRRTPELARR